VELKPLLYIPYGALKDTSPFSITRKPVDIRSRSCFIFFDDENFHYAVEYAQPPPGKGGIEDLRASVPWPQDQIAGAKKISSEYELRYTQSQV